MSPSVEKGQSDTLPRRERARERETIRYYETWLESRRGYLTPKNVSRGQSLQHGDEHADAVAQESATWKISRDKALVAFAQLGCLRLNAKRGLVTLITTSNIYILAEATKTVSLLAGGHHADGDELWFGTASIPRSQGVSEHALNAEPYTAKSPDGQEYSAPALVLEDITQDPRFCTNGYAGKGVTFYAGVPIVTENGFTIGVFNVTDDKPRPGGLSSEELRFMQDVASTIVDHLENLRNDTARHRGERLVLGLGAFTEGGISLDTENDDTDPAHEAPSETSGHSLIRSTFKGLTIFDTDRSAPHPTSLGQEQLGPTQEHPEKAESRSSFQEERVASISTTTTEDSPNTSKSQHAVADGEAAHDKVSLGSASQDNSLHSLEYRRTFSRAANILRQCTNTDGVMFFDTSSASVGDVHQGFFGVRRTHSNDSTSSDDAHYSSAGSGDDLGESLADSAGLFDRKHQSYPENPRKTSVIKNCELLGSSFRDSTLAQANSMRMKETEMRRFLRKYPKGMVMHFTEDGIVSSSEEGSVKDRASHRKSLALNEKKKAIARDLIKLVPGARNVIWLPLWDFLRSRWAAGCFIWTSRPGRLLDAQEDLIYIKAFANTIMSEINRLEAIASDQAKTSFAANISHELRSPLHGILGSIEFLQDTAIDAFQTSMITTVETCGKTLLDTLNHVLDFAQFSKQPLQGSQRSDRRAGGLVNLEEKEEVDLAKLTEEVIESIFAGQTFQSAGAFHKDEDDEIESKHSLQNQVSARDLAQRTRSKFSGAVQVIVNVEKLDNWVVRTKPGAIRRIVMNLFGNALKYTDRGLISITLSPDEIVSHDHSQLKFRITVADTGKGMSAEFLKHHAWKPFSQEDSFASGIGLGLSIVRQITTSLGGETALESVKDRGTIASITATVPRGMPSDRSHDLIKAVAQRVNGLKLCLLKPEMKKLHGVHATANEQAEDVFTHMAASWFGLNVSSSKSGRGVTADFFLYMEPPPTEYLQEQHGLGTTNVDVPLVVITPNAFESATLRKDTQKLKDLGRILEIISQPCGPAKFAMTLERCLERGHSNGLPEVTSPWTLQDDQKDIGATQTEAATQGPSAMSLRANPQPNDQQSIPEQQRKSQSQSGLSGPTWDYQTDDTTASIDGRVLSGAGTNSQAVSAVGDDKDGNKPESTGPVLLVDDNEVNLKLLVAFVRKAKYVYETASDGLEALNMYKEASRDPKHAFKTVVMDIQMPVMDGITATKEIRAFESKNHPDRPTFIMALTGLAGESTQNECMKAGVDHFLAKPLKFKDFLDLLRQR